MLLWSAGGAGEAGVVGAWVGVLGGCEGLKNVWRVRMVFTEEDG